MRYIRTKDGKIIDLVAYKENAVINNGIKFVNKINGSYFFIQQSNILNQTDTIEKLFDEFVITSKSFQTPLTESVIDCKTKDILEVARIVEGQIYGAIWANGEYEYPILKSVAKMKGVLPNGEIDWELL